MVFDWMPSHDWMKAHPWLTNDILSFQSAGGEGGQACQLPATAETPLVNLPLAGLNKIRNVKSPAHCSFSLPCASRALRHISYVMAMNQSLPKMSEHPIYKCNAICLACRHPPRVSCKIWENIQLTDNWLLIINRKVTFTRKNTSLRMFFMRCFIQANNTHLNGNVEVMFMCVILSVSIPCACD